MDWLQPSIANQLQFFTFPLELVGLTLATIEVRYPNLTSRMNRRLITMNNAVMESDRRWREAHPLVAKLTVAQRFHLPAPYWLQWAAIALVITTVMAVTLLSILEQAPELQSAQDVTRDFIQVFFWWIYAPLMVVVFGVMGSIRFVVSFVEDRAVGTMGILIAGLGVAGEAYQFMVSVAGIQ